MTPEETLDWLAQQHFDQCREERPIQDWIRKMKSQLPAQPEQDYPTDEGGYLIYSNGTNAHIAQSHADFEARFESESIWIGTGHLREILNGNTMNAYCSPEQDRFTDVQLYTTPPHSFFEDVADELRVEIAELQDQIRLLEKQLAQPEHEPACCTGNCPNKKECNDAMHCLYTTPPTQQSCSQRTAAEGEDTRRAWVGLTEEDMDWLHANTPCIEGNYGYRFIRAIEAKLKAKNERLEKNT